MTDKQRKFCDEYLIDCNATRAVKAAYPNIVKDNVAQAYGCRILKSETVKSYIESKLAEISDNKTATVKEVVEYLTSVMRGESSSEIVVVTGDGDGCSSPVKVKKSPDEKEKLKAAELLCKRFGLFTDKLNVDVKPITIVNDLNE